MTWLWKLLKTKLRLRDNMKNLLKEFVVLYDNNDEFKQKLNNLQMIQETEEWKTFRDILITIKGVMATDMFSARYTGLELHEKDVMQRTYYNIDQILSFLLKPSSWVRKRSRWAIINNQLMAKAKGGK